MSEPDDYLWSGSGPADPEVARLEQLLKPLAHDRPLDELRLRKRRSRTPWIVGALVAIAASVALVLILRRPPGAGCEGGIGFEFTAHTGTVACGGTAIARGVLPVGGVLDTGANKAELKIADIGSAQLAAGTRVRLDRTEHQRHELFLERGHMHAVVNAPPRIFAVTTPSTNVTDLGCEYTIEIDDKGQGWIEVQTGKVELESASGAVVVAPAGTKATLLAGRRPSLPIARGASDAMRAAVVAFEQGDADAVDRVLAAATEIDMITLVNLVELAPGPRRADVLTRLAAVVPPPANVTIEQAATTREKLDLWREDVVIMHLGEQALRGTQKNMQPK